MSAISYSIRGQLSWHKRMYAFRYVFSYQYIVTENIGINALTITTRNFVIGGCVVWFDKKLLVCCNISNQITSGEFVNFTAPKVMSEY